MHQKQKIPIAFVKHILSLITLTLSISTPSILMSSPAEKPTQATQETFKHWRNARRGTQQAEDMTNPFWVYCVQNELDAYQANDAFNGPSSFAYKPCWSYRRFGMSETKLEDGRTVHIAGEHEDYYDPDFFIYNDVIVKHADGTIQIFGYPEEIFPATDFHSAPLVGDRIYIIGALGYADRRKENETPVYYLNLKDYSIHLVEANNGPGWVFEHEATYEAETHSITIDWGKRYKDSGDIVDNFNKWKLDLDSKQWTLLEDRPWSQYRFSREDGEANHLLKVRLNIPPIDISTFGDVDIPMDEETKAMLTKEFEEQKQAYLSTDRTALDKLYRPSIPHTLHPQTEEEDEHSRFRLTVEEVTFLFQEGHNDVVLTIQGQIDEESIKAIVKETTQQLSAVEGTPYISSKLQ